MQLKHSKLRVVVPEKRRNGYVRSQERMHENEGIKNAIAQTLNAELPDVGECVELDVERIAYALRDKLCKIGVDTNWDMECMLAEHLASCKDVVKWKQIKGEGREQKNGNRKS